MLSMILGLTVAAVALSIAAAVMARMRRRAFEHIIIAAWAGDDDDKEGADGTATSAND